MANYAHTGGHPDRLLVIGIGNDLRGDDGAGRAVVEDLADRELPGIRAIWSHQLVPELAEPIAAARRVVFVDCALPGHTDGSGVDGSATTPCVLRARWHIAPVFRARCATVPANPAPVNPAPASPVPANPVPANPVPANPVPANPAPANPAPASPVPTNPGTTLAAAIATGDPGGGFRVSLHRIAPGDPAFGGHQAAPESLLGLARLAGLPVPPAYLLSLPVHDLGLGDGLSGPAREAVAVAVGMILQLAGTPHDTTPRGAVPHDLPPNDAAPHGAAPGADRSEDGASWCP